MCFDEKRLYQTKKIRNTILNKSTSKFKVLDNEAGIGKTTAFIDSMVALYKRNSSVKTLFM